MGGQAVCPGEESLVRFLAGRAADGERDSITRHADACSACALVLALPGSASPVTGGEQAGPSLVPGSLRAGSVLAGRYRILQPLGAGGMGEVYEVFDLSLGEKVALKTVRATIADDPRAVELLKSEVQLARPVTHPHVCRIFDFGVDGDARAGREPTPFLTMELLRGTTLARILPDAGPFSRDEVVSLARQIAGGLAAAHRAGVIHKDLKSENIILTRSPEGERHAFVTDFGLAATRSAVERHARPAARFSGTPGYVAPERLAGGPATEASDVFALGVVLEDLLTGKLPSRRTRQGSSLPARDPLAALAARCQAAAPSARPSLPGVVEALRRLDGPAPSRRTRALTWSAGVLLAAGAAALSSGVVLRRAGPAPTAASMPAPALAAAAAGPRPAPAPSPAGSTAPAQAAAPTTKHAARRLRAPAAAAAPTPRAPARVTNADEPIRNFAPTARPAPRDDAPIDPFSHAR